MCIVIPVVFLVTSMIVDFVLYSQNGARAFDLAKPYEPQSTDEQYDPETDPLANMSENTGLVFVFATLANTMVFFLVCV